MLCTCLRWVVFFLVYFEVGKIADACRPHYWAMDMIPCSTMDMTPHFTMDMTPHSIIHMTPYSMMPRVEHKYSENHGIYTTVLQVQVVVCGSQTCEHTAPVAAVSQVCDQLFVHPSAPGHPCLHATCPAIFYATPTCLTVLVCGPHTQLSLMPQDRRTIVHEHMSSCKDLVQWRTCAVEDNEIESHTAHVSTDRAGALPSPCVF